jgi:hypothetical protein
LKFHAKYVCIQGVILRFKRYIDKNYVLVKRFPTLRNWNYFSLRHVNSITLDKYDQNIVLKDRQRQVVYYMTDKNGDLYASLPVSFGKSIIYNMPFWNLIVHVIMTSMITCLELLSRHLQRMGELKGSTTLYERLCLKNPLNFRYAVNSKESIASARDSKKPLIRCCFFFLAEQNWYRIFPFCNWRVVGKWRERVPKTFLPFNTNIFKCCNSNSIYFRKLNRIP